MARRRSPRGRSTVSLIPRVKVWLEVDGKYVFGHGLSEILEAVGRAGSLKGAAAELGKSYRYVWARVKEAEEALGQSLVETQVGGQGTQRSCLTETARTLVADFNAVRNRMTAAMEKECRGRFRG